MSELLAEVTRAEAANREKSISSSRRVANHKPNITVAKNNQIERILRH
jgi:hypothetical protein